MKTSAALVAFLGLALCAMAQDGKKPVNDTCPVKGTPAKASITAEYEGKIIAFC